MNVLLIILITLMPAIAWFFLWRIQDKEKEPFKAMIWCFLLGILAAVPFFVIREFLPDVMNTFNPTFALFLLAASEEIVKAMMVVLGIELSQRWFSQIVDGLIYGSVVALGFAFAENVIYLVDYFQVNGTFVLVYFMRSVNTMVAHSLFTAFFGFFYASAYLRHDIFHPTRRGKPWQHFWTNLWECLPLHVTIFHILPNRPSERGHFAGSLIFEGILLASLLHGLFNFFLNRELGGTNLSFLTFPLVFGLGYLAWRIFLQRVYIKIVHHIKG
ncbi:MAG: PrsW family glutamic-type intramembrane protease [bacterium]|nr:PrsW family glutamic-type intramembrane protease [bacterium]